VLPGILPDAVEVFKMNFSPMLKGKLYNTMGSGMKVGINDTFFMSSNLADRSSFLLLLKPFAKVGIVAANSFEFASPEEFRLSIFSNGYGDEPLPPVYTYGRGCFLLRNVELDRYIYVPSLALLNEEDRTLLEFSRLQFAKNIVGFLPGADLKRDTFLALYSWERDCPIVALFLNLPVLVVDLYSGTFELLSLFSLSDLTDGRIEEGRLESGFDVSGSSFATSGRSKKLVLNPEPF
jgi:hypothetical protein